MFILASILVLGFLIVFHELGHFLVAKRVGVGVLKFSVGFGPTLFGRKIGNTEYVISAIPLGGFVKMVGEDPDEELTDNDRKVAFQTQALWKRLAIVLAGPAANLLLAFLVFSFVFAAFGARVPTEVAKVGGVTEGMPAAAAGLQAGDVITSINSKPIEKWEQLSEAIRASEGKPVTLNVQRAGSAVQIEVTPQAQPDKTIFGETVGTAYLIGVERGMEIQNVGVITALSMGVSQTVSWSEILLTGVGKMLQGKVSAKEIGGPIQIVKEAGKQARAGWENLLYFMAVISVNLGVLNLLPIPVLDGGHLVFFAFEAVLRRPLDLRHREIAQQFGFVVLVCLMVFAFYNDITRLIQGWG